MTAAIKFVQGASVGTPGQALMGVTGTAVVVSNGTPASSYKFEVLDVAAGSTVPTGTVQEGSTPSWSFTPDQPGGYLLRLTVVDAGGTTTDERTFGVPEPSGYFIPAFLARGMANNFGGQMRGWAKYLEELLRHLLAGGGGGGVPPGNPGDTVVLGNPATAFDVNDRIKGNFPGAGYFGGETVFNGLPAHQEYLAVFLDYTAIVGGGDAHGYALTSFNSSKLLTAGGVQILQDLRSPPDLGGDAFWTATCELTAMASDNTGANVVKKALWKRVGGVFTQVDIVDESNALLTTLPGAAAAVSFQILDVGGPNPFSFRVNIDPTGMPTSVVWSVSTHLQCARKPV